MLLLANQPLVSSAVKEILILFDLKVSLYDSLGLHGMMCTHSCASISTIIYDFN